MEYYCFNCKLIFIINSDSKLECDNCHSDFIEKYFQNKKENPCNFKIYQKNEQENNQNSINRTISFNFNDNFVRNTLYPLFQRNFERSRLNNLQRIELNFIRMILENNILNDDNNFKTCEKFIKELILYKKTNPTKDEECTICKENYNNNIEFNILPCLHEFHNKCLIPWLEINYSCPNCRKELPKELLETNI